MAGFNIAFAQEITSDADKIDQGSNLIWMVGAFLVFFMQAGFAFLGAGLIRSKNTTNYMTKSFMDFGIASLSFWAFGLALMWGTSAAGIAGTTNFFLTDGADGQTSLPPNSRLRLWGRFGLWVFLPRKFLRKQAGLCNKDLTTWKINRNIWKRN